ncbi:MAG: SDR family NAD(P)-dependent oxidoreductase [Sciscionella sp.]
MPLTRLLDRALDRLVIPGYTAIGYRLRREFWLADPGRDCLAGKNVLVTGANSGLGKATAAGVCSYGAVTHLLVRDVAKGEAARRDILRDQPDAQLRVHRCDLSSFEAVRGFAEEFASAHSSVHALVHNAGLLPPRRTESPDGHELTLAVHVLGPYLLTGLLSTVLAGAQDSRVIFVSSGGMYTQRLRMDDPEYRRGEYRGASAYARTKRMQVCLAGLLGEKLAARGIHVHSAHPGWANTPGVTESLPGFNTVLGPLLRTPRQGADTLVWLAGSDEAARSTGLFWHDRLPRPEYYLPWQRDSASDRAALWEFCVGQTGIDIRD